MGSQGVFLFLSRPNGAFLAVKPALREVHEQDAHLCRGAPMPSKKSEEPHRHSYLEQLAKRIRRRFDISNDFSNRLLGLFLVALVALLLLICANSVHGYPSSPQSQERIAPQTSALQARSVSHPTAFLTEVAFAT